MRRHQATWDELICEIRSTSWWHLPQSRREISFSARDGECQQTRSSGEALGRTAEESVGHRHLP